jgi:hypothetical protein
MNPSQKEKNAVSQLQKPKKKKQHASALLNFSMELTKQRMPKIPVSQKRSKTE